MNQGHLSWCYSFAVSDLISQKMQKTGALKPGESIHPLQLAAETNLTAGQLPNSKIGSGASMEATVDLLPAMKQRHQNLCKMSDLGPETDTSSPLFRKSVDASMTLFRKTANFSPAKDDCENSLAVKGDFIELNEGMNEVARLSWQTALSLKCNTPVPDLKWDIQSDLARQKQFKKDGSLKVDAKVDASFKKKIDQALQRGVMAGIGYSMNLISPSLAGKENAHASSIVGREKKSDGQCYYQVRNTWGPGCGNSYRSVQCEGGYFWVSEKDLLPNLFLVQSIL